MGEIAVDDDELTPRPNKVSFEVDIDALTTALPTITHAGPSGPSGTSTPSLEAAQAVKNLPKRLERPPKADIPSEALNAISPGLADLPRDLIMTVVREKGPVYLKTLAMARVEQLQLTPGERTARYIDVALRRPMEAAAAPTHVIAVVEAEAEQRRREGLVKPTIRLIPVYSIVLATQCAKLPPLPPQLPDPMIPGGGNQRVRLPVCQLVLPDMGALPILLNYLYSHSTKNLLRALLPLTEEALPALATPPVFNLSSTPAPPQPAPEPSARVISGRHRARTAASQPTPAPPAPAPNPPLQRKPKFNKFALPSLARSASKAGIVELTARVRLLHGLWANAIALGVHDDALWAAMHSSWDILLGGITAAVMDAAGQAPRPPVKPTRKVAGKQRVMSAASRMPSASVPGPSLLAATGSSPSTAAAATPSTVAFTVSPASAAPAPSEARDNSLSPSPPRMETTLP
ncbi:hypothetical protein EXIGLDRAFT_729039 [Exidia glandulosa HHB12029]|uniref:Uncharacterized protein n=1 Tax=Exidia glandulosa HHB12029 TaxID=1314781 RepID=A0A165CSW5_EXIGL|nr:hypothetical protein EXIGLDRAFT_729039 [Exidia glandulosa HHB12029]